MFFIGPRGKKVHSVVFVGVGQREPEQVAVEAQRALHVVDEYPDVAE